jgi:hypothetical protein
MAIKQLPALPGMKGHSWVVATNSLTPFHRLYGVIYGVWLHPSFMVYALISDRDDLLRTIGGWIKPDDAEPAPAAAQRRF